MGLYSMSYAIAFILAPLIGFFIVDLGGYKILWLAMLLIALLTSVGFAFNVSEQNKAEEPNSV